MSETYRFYGDDSELNAAIDEAQRRLPEFRRALEEDARRLIPVIEGALVKARFASPVTGAIEHIWIEDVGFEDEKIVGTIANDPNDLPELSKGDWVSISHDDISDWAYRQGGRTVGGFTVRVMQKRGLEP